MCWLNVGSKYEVSKRELANLISKNIEFQGKIIWDKDKLDETPKKKLDTYRINSLSWEAKTNLEKGITLTIESYKRERL